MAGKTFSVPIFAVLITPQRILLILATLSYFEFCTFASATIHRRFGIFRLGTNYSLSNVSCDDAEKVLRTGEQSGDKSPQSKKNAKLELT
jgi:hypothetical protein